MPIVPAPLGTENCWYQQFLLAAFDMSDAQSVFMAAFTFSQCLVTLSDKDVCIISLGRFCKSNQGRKTIASSTSYLAWVWVAGMAGNTFQPAFSPCSFVPVKKPVQTIRQQHEPFWWRDTVPGKGTKKPQSLGLVWLLLLCEMGATHKNLSIAVLPWNLAYTSLYCCILFKIHILLGTHQLSKSKTAKCDVCNAIWGEHERLFLGLLGLWALFLFNAIPLKAMGLCPLGNSAPET